MCWARLATAVCSAGRSGSPSGDRQRRSRPGSVLAVSGYGPGSSGGQPHHREADAMSRNAAAMIEEPRKGLTTSLLAQALRTGRLVLGPPTGPRWRSFPATPKSVSRARRFTEKVLGEVAETDADHVDEVVLVVSELITNAVREVAKLDPVQGDARPVHLGVAVHPRWTHLYAVDTAPALPKDTPTGPLAGSGRGIPIIRNLAAMAWVEQAGHNKTIHVVVTRTDVELTPQEKQTLTP